LSKSLLHTIAIHLDIIAPLAALFFVLFRKEKRLGEHIYIVIFLLIQLSLNSWIKIIMHCNCGNNIYLYKANCFLSFITLGLYFLHKWKPYTPPRNYRKATIALGVLSLTILALIYYDGFDEAFNSYSYSLAALSICTGCILYYYAKLKRPDIANIITSRSFWFVSGLFIYYAGCFFIFLSFKFLTLAKTPNASIVWSIHNIIFVPMCIAFSIGFRCSRPSHTI
jgi:hypothetical protein